MICQASAVCIEWDTLKSTDMCISVHKSAAPVVMKV